VSSLLPLSGSERLSTMRLPSSRVERSRTAAGQGPSLTRSVRYVPWSPSDVSPTCERPRWAIEIDGLRWATHVGELPDVAGPPGHGWSVEDAIPWVGLDHMKGDLRLPPQAGDVLRMQADRAHHDIGDPDVVRRWQERWGPTVSPFHGWTWSPQGSTDVHDPEAWVPVEFTD
jgi:hypothetical protein